MRVGFCFSYSSCCYFCLLVVGVLFHLCLCDDQKDGVLCKDDERQTLLEFKHGLIDGGDRLASWVGVKDDCCNWAGIVCDNFTGHVYKIHLPGNCSMNDYNEIDEYEEIVKQKLRGDISPSLVKLKQLKHLDLSCNNFGEMEVPRFLGSLGNLRYLNLSRSMFGGVIPPQLGNLTKLRVLCLGSFYLDTDEYESTSITSMQWLSNLRLLRHLDLSNMDLSEATDWLQVINTLPSLIELHLSRSLLLHTDPYVANPNATSLSLLDLSGNNFNANYVLQWIFSKTSLVLIDLSGCGIRGPVPSSVDSFRNLTSLELLHVRGNNFMSSSSVLQSLSSVGGNLISLDISSCGISSLVLGSLHNLTSMLSLELSYNVLNKTIPKSLGKLCNLRYLGLDGNYFANISFTSLLESFFECKSSRLDSLSLVSSQLSSHIPNQLGKLVNLKNLQLGNNNIIGVIPESIGRLSYLRSLYLANNLISDPIPYSIGGLSSIEVLDLSNNQLNGSLPASLGQLSKIIYLDLSYNILTGVITETHFDKLADLKYLNGVGNYLSLRPRLAKWVPTFKLQFLYLSLWDLGPQFPSWLKLQKDLVELEMSNTRISTKIHEPYWRSLLKLQYLNMSRNQIQGRLFGIPASLRVLDLNSNKLGGQLPELSNNSQIMIMDLSNNSFDGSLHHFVCSFGEKAIVLNLANNNLSHDIPECWEQWPNLSLLNLENNNLLGQLPRSLGSLSSLQLLNVHNNKLSGRLPMSLKNLTNLKILQLAGNELVGPIPTWLATEFLSLRILNLRSNNFSGNTTRELCYLSGIQVLDLSHNNLSGNIPSCFSNFTLLTGKETIASDRFTISYARSTPIIGSVSLFIKGREDTYSTILGLVMMLDLSSNNYSGSIPSDLMALRGLKFLNLSRNQLTGRIPGKIGDLKSLSSFDVSLNQLSGELPRTLSSLNFLSSFNVSYNNLTGRIPSSTQLQSFNESCFLGNKLCGYPLTKICVTDKALDGDNKDDTISGREDWGFIVSIMSGFLVGLCMVLAPLIVNTQWRVTYFYFLDHLRCMFGNVVYKYSGNLLSS